MALSEKEIYGKKIDAWISPSNVFFSSLKSPYRINVRDTEIRESIFFNKTLSQTVPLKILCEKSLFNLNFGFLNLNQRFNTFHLTLLIQWVVRLMNSNIFDSKSITITHNLFKVVLVFNIRFLEILHIHFNLSSTQKKWKTCLAFVCIQRLIIDLWNLA